MHQKGGQSDLSYLNHIKRLPCQPSQSPSMQHSQNQHQNQHQSGNEKQQYQSDGEGQRAIQQFRRQIQQRFKLSVANKLYSFPRKLSSAQDLLSSDQDTSDQQHKQQNQDGDALKPISKVQYQNKQSRDKKSKSKSKQNQPFRKKQIYSIRQGSAHKPTHQQTMSSNIQNKLSKAKKKIVVKSREKQKKQESYRAERQKQRQRETNRSKRFNTEPDSYNYVQTLRPKNRR